MQNKCIKDLQENLTENSRIPNFLKAGASFLKSPKNKILKQIFLFVDILALFLKTVKPMPHYLENIFFTVSLICSTPE